MRITKIQDHMIFSRGQVAQAPSSYRQPNDFQGLGGTAGHKACDVMCFSSKQRTFCAAFGRRGILFRGGGNN